MIKKKFQLERIKQTPNFAVYGCPTLNNVYVMKSVLPSHIPQFINVTIEVEDAKL